MLQGADDLHVVGSTIEAGLPNIKGNLFTSICTNVHDLDSFGGYQADKDYLKELLTFHTWSGRFNALTNNSSGAIYDGQIRIDASRSNPIYGRSTTVQPPALCVNIWKRIS